MPDWSNKKRNGTNYQYQGKKERHPTNPIGVERIILGYFGGESNKFKSLNKIDSLLGKKKMTIFQMVNRKELQSLQSQFRLPQQNVRDGVAWAKKKFVSNSSGG